MTSKTKRKSHRQRADKYFSLIVRARGSCEDCGSKEFLQCAHIIPRGYNATRVDLDNAFCLCRACHMRYTHRPLEFAEFVVGKIGHEMYHDLKVRARSHMKVNWKAEADALEEAWNKLVV